MNTDKKFLEDDLSFDPFNNVPTNDPILNDPFNNVPVNDSLKSDSVNKTILNDSSDHTLINNTDVNNSSIDSNVFTESGNFQRIAIDGEKSRALEERMRAAQPKPQAQPVVHEPRNPFREIVAFIAASICFWFGALFYIMTFNMEYSFNLQMITIIFPLLFCYGAFIFVNKQINCIEIIVLMVMFVVMSHYMFQITLARAMSKLDPSFDILEMLQIVKNRSQIKEITEIYNFHFIPMYGFLAVLCIISICLVVSIQKDKRQRGGK